MPEIIAIHFNDERIKTDDMVFCELDDGRMLLTSGAAAVEFSTPMDADPVAAFQTMFEARPLAFREVRRHEARTADSAAIVSFTPAAAGFTANLTNADQFRMRQIVRKHHKRYFASHPTDAQVDQLIDSLGPEVASKLVKEAVDKGLL